jgi:hypothetical protein
LFQDMPEQFTFLSRLLIHQDTPKFVVTARLEQGLGTVSSAFWERHSLHSCRKSLRVWHRFSALN